MTERLDTSCIETQILEGLKGKEFELDDYIALLSGQRISPKAIRTLIATIWNGFDQKNSGNQLSDQFRWNALMYGYYCDLVTPDEFEACLEGNQINGNLVETESDLLVDNSFDRSGNIVFGSIQQVHEYIQEERVINPDLQVLLAHGKWNGIPHYGHLLCVPMLESKIEEIGYRLDPDNVLRIVLCDTNDDIKGAQSIPFLTTLWRVSLMSYAYHPSGSAIDILAPSENFDGQNAGEHWRTIYNLLRPNFINVASDHKYKDDVYARCHEAEAIPIEIKHKAGEPFPPDHPYHRPRASSTSLVKGTVNDLEFRLAMTDLRIKDIFLERYGSRDLFS